MMHNKKIIYSSITRWRAATHIIILMINHWLACCMVNAEVPNLKQLAITCIYELQLRKTDGDFKVFGHDFKNLKVIASAGWQNIQRMSKNVEFGMIVTFLN